MGQPLTIGIIGCGTIVAAYLATFPKLKAVKLTAAADIDPARAVAVAQKYPGVRALSVADLLADDQVDLVLNLTIPVAHAEIALQAIGAGKSLYNEKPLSTTTRDARLVLDASATATLATPGPEPWHPNPDFYYVPGGGPLLDMGPYYISALVTLLGPIASVIGAASHTRSSRTIGSGPRQGERIPVSTDTHVTGVLVHASGALSALFMSFDVVATMASRIEVHGETGSLVVPDPNRFDGDVRLRILGAGEWETLPVSAGYVESSRGIGLEDLANTAKEQEPRAGGQLAFHVLEVMESLLVSAREGKAVAIESRCDRPPAVPLT